MSDVENRSETQSLLPASDPRLIAARARAQAEADHPTQIGPYRVLQPLGEGGMGTVYLAEQTKPIHRKVALKIIKLGMDTKSVIARFEAEREALALMDHPNVAKVFDAGATETGRPYFVMEHVPGIPITEYCDTHRLNTEERLRLFMDVCHAVQHAHQKGIIHRDIKPSNVLVAVQDDRPRPKVIDFGVAKATQHRLTERTVFTENGQLIGTPGYMSPEQAEMSALDIDTRTDIYSLGVMLYELLVGSLPFDTRTLLQAGFAEIQRIIRHVDPPKPSTKLSSLGEASTTVAHNRRTQPRALAHELRGDLDWIVMKCIEKDRTRRYDAANGLAQEIERHLQQEPVLAGPPSALYRFRKLVARNQAATYAVVIVFVALLASTIFTSYSYLATQEALSRAVRAEGEHRRERDRATQAAAAAEAARQAETQHRLRAEENEARATTETEHARLEREKAEQATQANRRVAYDLRIALAQRARAENNLPKLFKLLNLCPADLRGWEWHHLKARNPQYVMAPNHGAPIRQIGFSVDGRHLFSCGDDGTVNVFDTTDRSLRRSFASDGGAVFSAAMHPDAALFLTGSGDGQIRLWDMESGQLRSVLRQHAHPVTVLAFASDSGRLASGDAAGNLMVWDARLETPAMVTVCDGGGVEAIVFGSEGSMVCGTSQGMVTVLNALNGGRLASFRAAEASEAVRIVFARDGRLAVSADWSGIRCSDVAERAESKEFPVGQPVRGISVDAKGDRLAIVDSSGHLNLIDLATGLETLDLSSEDPVTAAAFSGDDRWLAAATSAGRLTIWGGPSDMNSTAATTGLLSQISNEDQRWRAGIERGLAWLATRQAADGAYGGDSHYGPHVGITALVGLAFLADGSDTASGQYAKAVNGCLSFILKNASESGLIAEPRAESRPMYGHSFAVLFLAAVQKRNPRGDVEQALKGAVALIQRAQNREGGWRYKPDSTDSDISNTACQVVALKAAANVGFPTDKAALDAARDLLLRCQNSDAGFRYMPQSGGSAFARSAAALAALLYLGEGGQPVTRGLAYLDRWDPSLNRQIGHHFYFQYYAAQAMWLAGGDRWGSWWPRAQATLLADQAEDGSWTGQAGKEYGTAMALIVLQFPSGTLPQLPPRTGR